MLNTNGLSEAAAPLITWLREHMHPHAYVLVDNERAQLLEGLASVGEKDVITKTDDDQTGAVESMVVMERGEDGVSHYHPER